MNKTDDPSGMDRRSAAKAIAKYAAYTAPAMAVVLNSEDAEAGRRRGRVRSRRRHRSPKAS